MCHKHLTSISPTCTTSSPLHTFLDLDLLFYRPLLIMLLLFFPLPTLLLLFPYFSFVITYLLILCLVVAPFFSLLPHTFLLLLALLLHTMPLLLALLLHTFLLLLSFLMYTLLMLLALLWCSSPCCYFVAPFPLMTIMPSNNRIQSIYTYQ